MDSLSALIATLERLQQPDRRLDSQIVARVLGPRGCTLDAVEGLDGWDIEVEPSGGGEMLVWRDAADVGHITHLIEDAIAFLSEARPDDAVSVLARSLQSIKAVTGAALAPVTQRLARVIVVETLRACLEDIDQQLTSEGAPEAIETYGQRCGK